LSGISKKRNGIWKDHCLRVVFRGMRGREEKKNERGGGERTIQKKTKGPPCLAKGSQKNKPGP